MTEDEEYALERVANGMFCYYENAYSLRHSRGKIVSVWNGRQNKTEDSIEVDQVKYKLHIMEECVVQMPISLGLEKNSPLKPLVDLWVR